MDDAGRQPREVIAPALAGYFPRGTQRVAARAMNVKDAPDASSCRSKF
jgi:hypothetical protein